MLYILCILYTWPEKLMITGTGRVHLDTWVGHKFLRLAAKPYKPIESRYSTTPKLIGCELLIWIATSCCTHTEEGNLPAKKTKSRNLRPVFLVDLALARLYDLPLYSTILSAISTYLPWSVGFRLGDHMDNSIIWEQNGSRWEGSWTTCAVFLHNVHITL